MEDRKGLIEKEFEQYYNSFSNLTEEHTENFTIKHDHSYRVSDLCLVLAEKLGLGNDEVELAYITGLLHDIGRFKQLIEYGTFNDAKSINHAELSVEVIEQNALLNGFETEEKEAVLFAIENHNKKQMEKAPSELSETLGKIIRDADKLDILKVLTDYYSKPGSKANHTLTWEMPSGITVSPNVKKNALDEELVEKADIQNQIDIKIMQMSWIFDINFKPSVEHLMKNRFLEKIYQSMSKSDTVIEIYRKVKVYAENRILESGKK